MAKRKRKRYTSDEIATIFFDRYRHDYESTEWSRWLTRKQTAWIMGTFNRENRNVRNFRAFGGATGSGKTGTTTFGWDLNQAPNGAGLFKVFHVVEQE